jgi:hypothetical protein
MDHLSSNAVFTLRDLNRQPAKVLEAVRKFGCAEIRTRSGEVFTMWAQPKPAVVAAARRFPDFPARWKILRELGHVPPTPSSQNEHIDRIIAGEE